MAGTVYPDPCYCKFSRRTYPFHCWHLELAGTEYVAMFCCRCELLVDGQLPGEEVEE